MIVRVLEGSGMVRFEEESGRSFEGLDGRLGEDMVGVRVWVPLGISGYVWLRLVTSGYVWVPMSTSGYVWVRLGMYGYV